MTQESGSTQPKRRPTGAEIMLQDLPLGARLRLRGGAEVEVVENPKDGSWLFARPVGSAPDQEAELVFAADVVELVDD